MIRGRLRNAGGTAGCFGPSRRGRASSCPPRVEASRRASRALAEAAAHRRTYMPVFEPVTSRFSATELEQRILDFWREHDIFKRSVEERPADRIFSFYEGPPTANGNPGVHHVLARVFKDLIPR